MEHVGNGVGAQAYGHGVYFAESKEVSSEYTGGQGIGGAPVPALFEINGVTTERGSPEQKAADLIYSIGIARAKKLASHMFHEAMDGEEWTLAKGMVYYEKIAEITAGINSKKEVKKSKGHLCQLGVHSSVFLKLLDWDKPLSAQGEAGKKIIEKVRGSYQDSRIAPKDMTGGAAYQLLSMSILKSQKETSEYMVSIGLVGNRYLDGLSREKWQGTYNYVIWDQSTLDSFALLERNGEKPDVESQDAEPIASRNRGLRR